MRFFLLCLSFLSGACLFSQKKALFLGNSYTNYNNLPALVESIANSLGDSLITAKNTPGGYTLQQHSTNATSLSLIASDSWDFVVLQEQSQRPSFPLAQVNADVLPYAELLVDSIHSNNNCTEAVFYMTWGRENGDASNCANWPPVCTYNGMQNLLRERYLLMAVNNDAWSAPVGAVWKKIRDQYPGIDLYTNDGSHPSFAGSYLAACTFYCTFFNKPATGAPFIGSLNIQDASAIQQLASSLVLDSATTWNIGVNDPQAAFTYSHNGNGTYQFFPTSVDSSNSYSWLIDQQSFSSLSPTVLLPNTGFIDAFLLATDSCGRTDSSLINIDLNTTNINDVATPEESRLITNGREVLLISDYSESYQIQVFGTDGKLVSTYSGIHDPGITVLEQDHPKGSFVYTIRSEHPHSGRIIVLE